MFKEKDFMELSRCVASPQHSAYTWDESKLCAEHRPVSTPTLTGASLAETNIYGSLPVKQSNVSIETARQLWQEYQSVFGFAPAELDVAAISTVMGNALSGEFAAATKRAAYRWFHTLDVPQDIDRNNRAWNLREGFAAGLFPYVTHDVEKARTAFAEKQDQWGRSLEASQYLLSYQLTLAWKFKQATLAEPTTGPLEEFVERVGNLGAFSDVYSAFGEMLYLFPQVVQEATGKPAVNAQRFANELLRVPAGYEAAEEQYVAQLNLAAQQEAQRVARQKQNLATAGKIGKGTLSIMGKLMDVAVNGTAADQASQARFEQRQNDKYIQDRNYNAAQQAKRNREIRRRQTGLW